MIIKAILETAYEGEASGALWIVDTPANRIWFEQNRPKLAENSALFSSERYTSRQDALRHMIWGIQDHFPDWQEIWVIGGEPALADIDELRQSGRWAVTNRDVILHHL
ncbi:hypothetical protein [Antarcticimicrobium luteum]|uniref:Uncharacterized protein n=1 Tax=Antarcticimicrobium luteum TaxID=2547397 RepID=A0A4R5UXH0_9RHOB|nr:hypothetical protein [Antarcticimicrobium luteum]TDK43825.1 hypothetical protein E1832_16225 [Antarcticimicrobium luteum]